MTITAASSQQQQLINNIAVASGAPQDNLSELFAHELGGNIWYDDDDDNDCNPPDISHEGGEYRDLVHDILKDLDPRYVFYFLIEH